MNRLHSFETYGCTDLGNGGGWVGQATHAVDDVFVDFIMLYGLGGLS